MKLDIKKQLFIFFVCFVLLATLILSSVMYLFFYHRMTDFVIGEVDFNIKSCTAEIDNLLSAMQRFNDHIGFDEKIVEHIGYNGDSISELVFSANALESTYKSLFNMYFSDYAEIINSSFLISPQRPTSKFVLQYTGIDVFEQITTGIYKTDKSIVELATIKGDYVKGNIILFYDPQKKGSIFYAQEIYDNISYNGEILGINIVEIDFSQLLLKYNSSNMAEAVPLVIIDEKSNVVYGEEFISAEQIAKNRDQLELKTNFSKLKINSKDYFVCSYPLEFGISLIAFAEPNYVSQRLAEMWKYVFAIIVLMLIILIFLASLMAKYLSLPIVKLSRTMAEFDEKSGVVPETGRINPVEIKELYKCFSLMISRIKELLRATEESAKKEKEMEMRMLGAQINPHFLYNALDSISWMAIDKGEDEIAEMIDVLSDSFRYSIKQTNDLISLREEMKFIIGYLQLQEMRYKDKFIFSLDIDSKIERLLIPKFIIQPLVENFVIHAIKPDEQNVLTISADILDDFLEIKVSDNGIGCDTDKLNRYVSGDETVFSKEKIGIRNVSGRIRIKFGENYGLSYMENEKGGTIAKLKLPIIEDKGMEEKNV